MTARSDELREIIETTVPANQEDIAAQQHQTKHIAHWDRVARTYPAGGRLSGKYHSRVEEVYRLVVPGGLRVIELGCGRGDLLAALRPSHGVGIDFSPEMLRAAHESHPELELVEADAHDLRQIEGPFDVIVLSDLVNDLWDVQTAFQEAHRLCHPRTRIVMNLYSHLWEPLLKGAARLGLATPRLEQSWLTLDDVHGLLALSGFDVVKQWQEVLLPLPIPGLETLADKYLAKVWPFRLCALANFVVARPAAPIRRGRPRVSVIVPARNEEGNIEEIFRRVPEMGSGTELIFVEGHSRDGTFEAIERGIAAHPEKDCKAFQQTGRGKGDAVRLGFKEASGDILMILDADLTVRPEDLPRFVEALESGVGEFINGVRLVYPMQDEAMRFFNLLGNKFFSLAFSWLLAQPVKDTLCGTKVLWKEDYEEIARNRAYFGDFDPFGDFDLLFGAAKLGLKIVDMPVRYQARTYGTTNIDRWRHGVLLLRMVVFAARRIKFV